MALENFNISNLYDDGTGPCFLCYLETDPPREKMVGVIFKMEAHHRFRCVPAGIVSLPTRLRSYELRRGLSRQHTLRHTAGYSGEGG